MRIILSLFMVMILFTAVSAEVRGEIITRYYGDDDGFGIGATTALWLPHVGHASNGEAPFTDVPLIGAGNSSQPAFTPTASFLYEIPEGEVIVGATLTMRAGSWVPGPNPVDGLNRFFLDGQDLSAGFLGLFTNQPTGFPETVETRSLSLSSSIFALLADGEASLAGTHLSENGGNGSFQIDFVSLEIQTRVVPEPAAFTLMAVGGICAAAGMWVRRRRALSGN